MALGYVAHRPAMLAAFLSSFALSILLPIYFFPQKQRSHIKIWLRILIGGALSFFYFGTIIFIDIELTDWTGTVGPEIMALMPFGCYLIALIFTIPAFVLYREYRKTLLKNRN